MSADISKMKQGGNVSGIDRGEATDVTELHAAIVRERPDPIEGHEPLNLWIVVFIAVLLFWAGSYLTQHSGGFRSDEFSEAQINPVPPPAEAGGGSDDPTAKAVKEGAVVFSTYCGVCHQPDGNGVSGQFPPLAGSEWVLADGPNRIVRIVLNGLKGPIKVKGVDYNNQMNAFRDTLDDRQIANVLTYIRNSWGNKASLVTAAEVVAIRTAEAARAGEWSAEELEKIPASGGGPGPAVVSTLTPEALKEALKKLPPNDLKALLQDVAK
jgi:mono/diheme cytochrome c family protein